MLPQLMGRAVELLERIGKAIGEIDTNRTREDFFPETMNIEQLCMFLPSQPAKSTVYGWVSDNLIPHYHEGKKLTFKKSEFMEWQTRNRTATDEEVQQKALEILAGLRTKGKRK